MKKNPERPNEIQRKNRPANPLAHKPSNEKGSVNISELMARRRHMSGLMCPPFGVVESASLQSEKQG